jgi:hypothetical protein
MGESNNTLNAKLELSAIDISSFQTALPLRYSDVRFESSVGAMGGGYNVTDASTAHTVAAP